MGCFFDINNLNGSLEALEEELYTRLDSVASNYVGLKGESVKSAILKEISDISENHQIDNNSIDAAMEAFESGIIEDLFEDEDSYPTSEEIRTAMLSWTQSPDIQKEDTSTKGLDDQEKNPQRVIEDPLTYAYGRALKARIRAEQHANTVGVHLLLYNDEGIINGINELNHAIQLQQETLLNKVIEYLKENIPNFEYSDARMYEDGVYTGIVEKIQNEYSQYLKFDFNELNDLYNKNKLDILDSYSSWVILQNFDIILKNIYGKAINIDGNKTKYNIGKYSIAGGSNVYTTWRTNEEIDLSKEVNNITQSIVKSLPYYTADSATPSTSNLKFNEFVYILSKIKELPLHAKQDFNIYTWSKETFKTFSQETQDLIGNRSLFQVINLLRDNPQKYLPAIIEVLNNKSVFNTLSKSIDAKYFASVDRDLINTIYQGLFSKTNPSSLLSIQSKSGFQNTNYFAFITQTIDSMYKSNFLQYFRDQDGEIYVRNMYDQSLYIIEQTIRQTINRFNSTLIANNYQSISEKYNPSDNIENFDIMKEQSTVAEDININGTDYSVVVGENQGVKQLVVRNKVTNDVVTDSEILSKVNQVLKSRYAKPEVVTYHINDFYKGPLTVQMNIKDGKIQYFINGENYSFETKKDYDSLSNVIQDILQQNFDISPDYLNAYLNRLSNLEGLNRYGEATTRLMQLVTRVITNQYIQENYIKDSKYKQQRAKNLYNGEYEISYNRKVGEIDFIGKNDTSIVKDLAEANALVTGRLTSSQILDGEGNALASSSLSRLVNSLPYQIETQGKSENSVVKHFILWNPGVYKGVSQLKELKDNKNSNSKNHVQFSNKEMENTLVFIDFLHGLINTETENTKTPLTNGVVGFYPSENSDKTFVGRLLIDLKAVQIGDTNLYNLIKEKPSNIVKFYPIIQEQFKTFYDSVIENINNEWKKVQEEVDKYILEYNNKLLETQSSEPAILRTEPITYGGWNIIKQLAAKEGISELEFVNKLVIKHNNENPNNLIVLRDEIHYVANKKGELEVNNSLVANYQRFASFPTFENFIRQQNIQVLKTLLEDGVQPDSNVKIEKLVGSEWIDFKTNRVILGKYSNGRNIKNITDLDTTRNDIILNPLVEAYNSLNYFFTQEYMNSSVGAFYEHPNKKHKNISLLSREEKYIEQLKDEKARKLAQDKRNVDFTAAMHAFQKNLLQGIPSEINVAIIPNSKDVYETIIGETFDIKAADDGACYTNPFYQILQNNSLGGARVGLIKKTFTHFYDEKTGTGGIFKDAEFPLTNEWIRRSTRYQKLMRNMTDRVWRNSNGTPATVNILQDYNGNPIEFVNPNCVRQGQLFYRNPVNGKYYAFWIKNGSQPNSYIKTVQRVDEHGMAIEKPHDEPEEIIDTNYKLWNFLGGAYSMEIKPTQNELSYCESSIDMVVKIMNNTESLTEPHISTRVETQEDIWQPLKHSDIHLMPTVGAVKMGIANINTSKAYEEENPEGINYFKIRTDQMGVQLDKEHHADGEDLSIMTQVISACASRGYTPEQTKNLYNALASLARAGIKPYIKNFEQFFKVSSRPGATPEQLREAKQNFENVLLDTLVKALANSKNDSATLQIITSELLEAAKEGKHIQFANMQVPLSDPAVMRKLHSTISVALTRAAIKIKVDGSLNMLCPSNGIIKVYGGKMGNEFLNSKEIQDEQKRQDENPKFELINNPDRIKLGRTYKLVTRDGKTILKDIKLPPDYWELKNSLNNYVSIREQFAPMNWSEVEKPSRPEPTEVKNKINSVSNIDDKIKLATELGVEIEEREPSTLEEIVAQNFPFKNLNSQSFKEESGIKNFQAEGKLQFFNNKTGISIIQAAENIMENVPVEMRTDNTLQEIRNIIIDFVTNYSPSQIKNYFKETLLNEGLSNYESSYNDEADYLESKRVDHQFEGGRELGAYNVTFSGKINGTSESPLIITGNPSTTAAKARSINGIDTLRHPDANGMHFGNPFTHLEKEVKEGRSAVLMPSVRESVAAFEQWLDGTAYQDVEPERRKWIVNQINSGVLAGRPLVYYTTTIKDDEGIHYYNPETFPNHAQVLQRRINQRAKEIAGPLFTDLTIEKGFNLYDLKSVKYLHDLKDTITNLKDLYIKPKTEKTLNKIKFYTEKFKNLTNLDVTESNIDSISKAPINEAMQNLQNDLNVLHGKTGQVETTDGFVTINPKSINIEPYEIVMPKIFATVFGLKEGDNVSDIKSNPDFFTKRLIENLNTIPQTINIDGNSNLTYTIALQRVNGKHTYILNSNDAVKSDNFKPKEIQKIRENGKLYRRVNDDLLYEMNENDQVWEYIDQDGNATEVIITDNINSYFDRIDYATININENTSTEFKQQLIEQLRTIDNKSVQNYIEMIDYILTREGETLDMAIEDIQDISITNYNDHPLGNHFRKLGNQIYASFLKSLEIVAARIPAQSMQSFMPMKVVGFEGSDINTAYVSTTQMLFQGSDYDIDAVSLAAYSFDKSGRYIIHSPLANIDSLALLKASQNIPFPTGEIMDINEDNIIDYNNYIRLQDQTKLQQLLQNRIISQQDYDREMSKPFFMVSGGNIKLYNKSPEAIENLAKFINYCNDKGYIPGSNAQSLSAGLYYIQTYVNKHNNYLNTNKNVEEFSKNFIVTSMFDIGISPANLIESQAALDSITGPLKDAASATLKAIQQDSLDNPANFTTNVHGLVQNMDGKQGVGICAVGLKGFFAATARYNEALNNGTPEEVARLKSDVEIAGKHFKMLANAHTTNEVNQAILGEIITQLDQTNDVALTLSALLSLATDNAKELALSKLNAANMLGMYIYGISIGMDFSNISKIIASNTGIVIDSLMKEDAITGERGMSMENIFDYIELGPKLENTKKISDVVRNKYRTILDRAILRKLAYEGKIKIGDTEYNFIENAGSLNEKYNLGKAIELLESQKINPPINASDEGYEGIIEYNRNIEKAQKYLQDVNKIINDQTTVENDGTKLLIYYKDKYNSIYGNIKKLYAGGEEMRTLGKILHINQGNETSYAAAIGYIDTVESSMSTRQYAIFREKCRVKELAGEKRPDDYSKNYEFNFHNFIFNESYRDGVIDLYGGICNQEKFLNDEDYRNIFLNVYPNVEGSLEEQYNNISKWITYSPSKVFINVLDVVQVPHYMEYMKSADMLFQYMSNSIKYRGIYKLGKRAILEIGAHSQNDREKIFRRTEQFIDNLMRDRFFFSLGLQIQIPQGTPYFNIKDNEIVRVDPEEGIVPPKKQLGTIEGNASFKLLMEDVIIPDLQKMPRFKNNKFIQSLKPTLFSENPEQQTTICRAPSINMSPRSETDSALFEEIKHDFNNLRVESYRYPLGNATFDLIDLFYYYNLIAFGGRVGENTLTNIFQDVLDYKNVKNYRDFESRMDKEGNLEISDKKNGIEGTISLDTLIRRVAIRASSFSTTLNYFYEENSETGLLEFKERNTNRYVQDPDSGRTIKGDKYVGTSASYLSDEGLKNYVQYSIDADRMGINHTYKDGRKVHMILEKGIISEISIDDIPIEIPLEDKQFFKNLKMIPIITAEGIQLDYDKRSILSKVDEIISCKI